MRASVMESRASYGHAGMACRPLWRWLPASLLLASPLTSAAALPISICTCCKCAYLCQLTTQPVILAKRCPD